MLATMLNERSPLGCRTCRRSRRTGQAKLPIGPWFGLVARAGLPREIVMRMNKRNGGGVGKAVGESTRCYAGLHGEVLDTGGPRRVYKGSGWGLEDGAEGGRRGPAVRRRGKPGSLTPLHARDQSLDLATALWSATMFAALGNCVHHRGEGTWIRRDAPWLARTGAAAAAVAATPRALAQQPAGTAKPFSSRKATSAFIMKRRVRLPPLW